MNDPGAPPPAAEKPQDGPSDEAMSRRALAGESRPAAAAGPSGLTAELNSAKATTPIQFQSNTIAPSPPTTSHSAFGPPAADEQQYGDLASRAVAHQGSSSLRISTDLSTAASQRQFPSSSSNDGAPHFSARGGVAIPRKASNSNLYPISRTPSLKTALAQSLGAGAGPGSAASSLMASPVISAMGDMTPLPSPLLSADSPGPWKKLLGGTPPKTRGRLGSIGELSQLNETAAAVIDASSLSPTSASRRKVYVPLEGAAAPILPAANENAASQHTRNRSASEYIPDPAAVPKRHITVSGSHAKPQQSSQEPHIRREPNFAESRGLTPMVTQPPTPPASESSKDSSELNRPKKTSLELYEAFDRNNNKRRRWRKLKSLGQGTFSQVVLATSQIEPVDGDAEGSDPESQPDRKTLVAVKICEHGPRGGASEERVEMSLKRELEILQVIHHPSLVDLKAFNIEPTRAILVLTYSAGGDLFDVATAQRKLLVPSLLQRIFAELVGAVRYLHEKRIVHRDIKLENVLVNLTMDELASPNTDWSMYPNSVITLTDLGLSRRIADDEKLETRCGSDDYAAPEVIMGQPYDGRATDAWSLGVLLYALLESRLPFDPHPGMTDAHRMRSRTSHRIARIEWRWVEFAGEDGDHEGDEAKFRDRGLLGGMLIAEGLLARARSRWTLDRVAEQPWVRQGIRVEGGVRFWEEQEGQEIPS